MTTDATPPDPPPASPLLVAGIQFDIAWMQPEENLRRVRPHVEAAAQQGARLIVLPEMFATGFTMEVERAGAWSEMIRGAVAEMARDVGATIIAGVAEGPDAVAKDNESVTGGLGANMAYAFGPDGAQLASYQKLHPFSLAGEEKHIAGGDHATVFEVDGVRVGLAVCYDLRFPEYFRTIADRVDLFVVPANWPSRRRTAWRALQQARAIDTLTFVVGCNRLGDDAHGIGHAGDSLAVDPFGEIITDAGDGTGPYYATIDAQIARDARERFSFLRDRRPDLYATL